MTLKYNNKLSIYYEDISDEISIKDCLFNYNKDIYKNKICLDLGANIGGFVSIALKNGAKQVICVECDSRNFELLSKNFQSNENVILIKGAVSNKNGSVKVYKNSRSKRKHLSAKTSDCTINGRYSEIETTDSYNIYELIEKYKPDIIKIDIEGSEFVCFENKEIKIDQCVKEILMEIHYTKNNKIDFLQHILDQFKLINKVDVVYFNSINGCNIYLKR